MWAVTLKSVDSRASHSADSVIAEWVCLVRPLRVASSAACVRSALGLESCHRSADGSYLAKRRNAAANSGRRQRLFRCWQHRCFHLRWRVHCEESLSATPLRKSRQFFGNNSARAQPPSQPKGELITGGQQNNIFCISRWVVSALTPMLTSTEPPEEALGRDTGADD